MTRQWVDQPVWTWVCDRCRRTHGLALTSLGLPDAEAMREIGWFVSVGTPVRDLCPICVSDTARLKSQDSGT